MRIAWGELAAILTFTHLKHVYSQSVPFPCSTKIIRFSHGQSHIYLPQNGERIPETELQYWDQRYMPLSPVFH